MRHALFIGLFVWFLGTSLVQAQAPSLRVVESDPGLTAKLGGGQTIYIRVAYRSVQPVRIRAEPFATGKKVESGAAFNISPTYPAGDSEASTWIAFRKVAIVDEIRIVAFDALWKPLTTLKVPAQLEWSETQSPARPRPQWAERMNREQQEMGRAETAKGDEDNAGIGAAVIAFGWFSIVAYFILQPMLVWKYAGGWRIAALIPLGAVVPLFAQAIYALSKGSNLWPIGLIFFMPIALVYLLIVIAVRWLARRMAKP